MIVSIFIWTWNFQFLTEKNEILLTSSCRSQEQISTTEQLIILEINIGQELLLLEFPGILPENSKMSSISRGISSSETRDDGSQLNRSLNNLYNKKITMIRSCSEVMSRVDYSSWPGHLHTRSAVANEMPLIGECRYCDQSCRCSCCPCCDHLVIIFTPVCSKHSKKKALFSHFIFWSIIFHFLYSFL